MKVFRKFVALVAVILIISLWGWSADKKVVEKVIGVSEDKFFTMSETPEALLSLPARLEIVGERIYVLDTEESQIKVFDKNGKFMRSIGRRGKGPGEFNRPEGFFIDRNKKLIAVADTGNRRVQVLNEDGQLVTSFNLTNPPSGVGLAEGKYYVLSFPGSYVALREEPLINIYSSDFNLENSFLKAIKTDDLMLNLLINSIIMKIDRAGNLICGHQFGLNKIEILDRKGKMVRSFEIIYKGERPEIPVLKMKIKSDKDVRKVPFILADISFDSGNFYYFLAGEGSQSPDAKKEKGREIYKYDSQGRYQGTIVLPCGAKLIGIGDDGALYLVDDNFELRKFVFRGK
ncbi:MAG: 6-bladed beta-propeller [Candidatus Aminicenantes bacterium]|nr:6-bladed beta-propeller [Candidatus Aminicenantes bacterium]